MYILHNVYLIVVESMQTTWERKKPGQTRGLSFPTINSSYYLQILYLEEIQVRFDVVERSACHTPRYSSKNWRGSMPRINSSQRTNDEGYPPKQTWQSDKWQSGFKIGEWRRRKSSTSLRVRVSRGIKRMKKRLECCSIKMNCNLLAVSLSSWVGFLAPLVM